MSAVCLPRAALVLVGVVAGVSFPNLAASAADPEPKRMATLTPSGKMKVTGLHVEVGAVLGEHSAVLVGNKEGAEDADPDTLDPNGAIVDLKAGKSRPFTNGHKARIASVCVARGRIATTSIFKDPVLRLWDIKADKALPEVALDKSEENVTYSVASFHKSDRVAVVGGRRLVVFDLSRPGKRSETSLPSEAGWAGRLSIDANDEWLAAEAGRDEVVFWKDGDAKMSLLHLTPPKEKQEWMTSGVAFGSKGGLFAWRSGTAEVPESKTEADVPIERRGIVRIETTEKKLVPLKMGTSIHTLCCAIDPSGEWLAVGGSARPDKKGDFYSVGELRIYHVRSGALAHRQQFDEFVPMWVAFTPSGKGLFAASPQGEVRRWDFAPR